jgi:hypothetical protein
MVRTNEIGQARKSPSRWPFYFSPEFVRDRVQEENKQAASSCPAGRSGFDIAV